MVWCVVGQGQFLWGMCVPEMSAPSSPRICQLTCNNAHDNQANHAHDDHHLCRENKDLSSVRQGNCHRRTYLQVLEPEFPLELARLLLKLRGTLLQGIGTVVQLRQLAVALQHLFHVRAHDVHDLVGDSELQWLMEWLICDRLSVPELTSSTCACVCCRRFCAAICCGLCGPPTISPSPPSPAGAPALGGASPAGAASALRRRSSLVIGCENKNSSGQD